MKFSEVRVHKLFNLGNYENMRIELLCTLEDSDSVEQVYATAYFMIEKLFKATRCLDRVCKRIEEIWRSLHNIEENIEANERKIKMIKEEIEELTTDTCKIRNYEEEELQLILLRKKKEIEEKKQKIEKLRDELKETQKLLDEWTKYREDIEKLLKQGKIDEVIKYHAKLFEDSKGGC